MILSPCTQRIIFVLTSLIMFATTFAFSAVMYLMIGNETWRLISSIQFRTILMINAVVSSMIFALGFVNVMKYQKVWQITYCFFLIIPIILCSIQMHYVNAYDDSTDMLFSTLSKSDNFLTDISNIVNELNSISTKNESCGECSTTNFKCCVSYASQCSKSFLPSFKTYTVTLLCLFIACLVVNVVYIFVCNADNTSYTASV